jgi:hypothetical protein
MTAVKCFTDAVGMRSIERSYIHKYSYCIIYLQYTKH